MLCIDSGSAGSDFQKASSFLSPTVLDCCWKSTTVTDLMPITYRFVHFLVVENSWKIKFEKEVTLVTGGHFTQKLVCICVIDDWWAVAACARCSARVFWALELCLASAGGVLMADERISFEMTLELGTS